MSNDNKAEEEMKNNQEEKKNEQRRLHKTHLPEKYLKKEN
jgi:hypothetical protein